MIGMKGRTQGAEHRTQNEEYRIQETGSLKPGGGSGLLANPNVRLSPNAWLAIRDTTGRCPIGRKATTGGV